MQHQFLWIPRFSSIIYLCADLELHELKALVWGHWAFFQRERMLASAESVQTLVNHVQSSLAAGGPVDKEGKPIVQ